MLTSGAPPSRAKSAAAAEAATTAGGAGKWRGNSPIFLTSMGRDKDMGKDKTPKSQAVIQECRDTLPAHRDTQSKPSTHAEDNSIFLKATGRERGGRSHLTSHRGQRRMKFNKPGGREDHLPSPSVVAATESEKSVDQPPVSDSPFWRRKIRRAFEMLDTQRRGSIMQGDLERLAQRYREKMLTATEEQALRVKIMFEVEATSLGLVNSSASLSLSGFLSKWVERVQRGIEGAKHFEEMFRAMDLDEEGHIYFYQLYMFYRAMGYGVPVEEVSAAFNAMDRDRDKLVSMADFVAYHWEYFYTADNSCNSSILYGPLARD